MKYAKNAFTFRHSALRLLILANMFTPWDWCYAETQYELYNRVFGENILDAKQVHTTPIFIGKKELGDINIIYNNNDSSTLVASKSIFKILKNILKPELLNEIISAANNDTYLNAKWFLRWEIKLYYDHEKLILTLSIPVKKRKLSIIYLAKTQKSSYNSAIHTPANLSAYVNIFYEQEFKRSSIPRENNNISNITLDSSLNYKGWILESSARFSSYSYNDFQHTDIKLIKDNVSQSIRYSIGYIDIASAGFQNTFSVGGLSIKKFTSFYPSKKNNARGHTKFFLDRESTVEILINGLHYKTLRLDAGRYDLRDFPISSGVNDIAIIIRDIFGHIKRIEFPLFSDIFLLEKNTYEYGVGLGFPDTEMHQDNENDALALSVFFRKGISSHLTLGSNYQNYRNCHLFGGEMRLSVPYGNFIIDSAISKNGNHKYGIAANIGYSYQRASTPEKTFNRWELSAKKYSPNFEIPSYVTNKNTTSLELTASVSIPLKTAANLSLRANFKKSFNDSYINKSAGLFFHQKLTKNMNWGASISIAELSRDAYETNFILQFNYQFGGKNSHMSSTYDSATHEYILNWKKRSTNTIGGINAELEYTKNRNKKIIMGAVSYNGNRFDTRMQHTASIGTANEKQKTQTTNLQLTTALVYADGHFSLSRVVADSFAIIVPHSSMSGRKVVVDPVGGSFSAETSIAGPAVINNLVSYTPRELSVDIPDLPIGYSIGNGLAYLIPTYRSGTVITLGSDANVILRGRLNFKNGKPISLTTGTITAVDNPGRKSILFFTNRNGLFQTDSLNPGAYQLKLTSYPNKLFSIEIPKNAKGIYDAGILKF